MTELQKRIRAFRIHLMLRIAGYAALLGLIVALVVVIAAPWLRESTGLPGYWLTIALPLLFPAAYVVYALLQRPGERESVIAADAWCGGEGSIISAYELEREHPDSPFVKPIAERAVAKLANRRLPEPRLLRKALVAMLVLLALVPLSRFVHAQLQEAEEQERAEELASKVDVPPEPARDLAKDAAAASERAREVKAEQQQKLADDLEQAARNAEAGGGDKERALREANSLVDRAKAQTEAAEGREKAREALEDNNATRELAEAIKQTDATRAREEIRQLAEQVYRKDGSIDPQAAEQLKQAALEAQRAAPQDARLRRAVEQLQQQLDQRTVKNAQQREQEARERMKAEGMDPAAIEAALEALNRMDKRALERALEELAKSSSPLRDLDVSGRQMEELLKQLEGGQISPEDASRLAETARQLSERLELDAETLRELLQKGQEFEGLENAARRMAEGTPPQGPEEVPEWARNMVPPEWEEAWRQSGNERAGNGPARGDREGTEGGSGPGRSENDPDSPNQDPGREIGGEGKKEGVDTSDTGDGEKDPEKDPERLDPNKAGSETAARGTTGRDGTSKGINTRDEDERLPRRYRDAARKYFERD